MVLGLQMKKLKVNFDADLVPLLNTAITDGVIELRVLSDAPKHVKLIIGYEYVAYKNIIYVPAEHLTLMQSKNEQDRLVAIAKVLPWAACIFNGDSTFFNLLLFRFGYKLRSIYFLYEYLFLKGKKSAYTDLIVKGFLVTRKRFLQRIKPEKVLDFLNNVLNPS